MSLHDQVKSMKIETNRLIKLQNPHVQHVNSDNTSQHRQHGQGRVQLQDLQR